ncbi:nuclear transport factor 2 family protein [Pectobacterium aroidearum]|uniref:nuclear transport factor 2 family protein n=1 Tax=Pectobacterium aroidearum TaxID=1201031 RepID=UPI0032F0757A
MSTNIKTVPTADYAAVVAVVHKYVEGIRAGSADTSAAAFYEQATYFGVAEGKLAGGSVETFYEFLRQNGKAPDVVAHIDVLAITTTAAVVRVDLENDSIGADYNDFVTLIKTDGAWKIISKVYHQFGA